MKSSMFLVAALVLCALPSALGSIWCYTCVPDMASGSLCTMMSQYTQTMCDNENSTCYMSSIMSGMVKSYALGCVNPPATCETTNTSVCQNATVAAMSLNMNVTIDMCMTSCQGNLSNIPSAAMMSPTPTATMTTMMASITSPTPTTKDAAEKLCPKFLSVLFIILFTILRQ